MSRNIETPMMVGYSYADNSSVGHYNFVPNTIFPWAQPWEPDKKEVDIESAIRRLSFDKPDLSNEINKLTIENAELRAKLDNRGNNSMRRLVKVIIVDPNKNLPLNKAMLFNGDEMLTDLEDQEIFFDMDIKSILKAHNDYRVTVVDKKASKSKDKDVLLEEIRIKDLNMVVLTIAKF